MQALKIKQQLKRLRNYINFEVVKVVSDKYTRLKNNTIIFAISSFGTKFLSFLLIPLCTNVLTTSEYGVADVITAAATLLVYVFTINIASSVLRFAIDKKENQDEILSYGFKVLTVGSLILIFILGITYYTRLAPWEGYYYIFIFMYYFSTALYQIMSNYLRAVDKIGDVGIVGIISSISIIIGNIVFLLILKMGIIGYLVSLNLGPFLGSVYCFIRAGVPLKRYIICSCDTLTKKNEDLLYTSYFQ